MLTVSTTSWHYRIYNHWRQQIARKPPARIDLCHYMRAIMLWTPGYYVGLALFYTGLVLLAAVSALVLALTSPLWFPVWAVTHNRDWHKRGARQIGIGFDRAGDAIDTWLRTGGQYVMLSIGVGVLLLIATLATLNSGWSFWLWVGVGVITAAGVVSMIVLLAWTLETLGERASRRRMDIDLGLRPPKPAKKKRVGPSWLSLCWQFLKAKKRRICPLIQTNERSTA